MEELFVQNNTRSYILRILGAIKFDTGLLIAAFVISYVIAVLGGAAVVAFVLQPTAVTFGLIMAMIGFLSFNAIHASCAPYLYDDPELPLIYKKISRQLFGLALLGATFATVVVVFLILLQDVLL